MGRISSSSEKLQFCSKLLQLNESGPLRSSGNLFFVSKCLQMVIIWTQHWIGAGNLDCPETIKQWKSSGTNHPELSSTNLSMYFSTFDSVQIQIIFYFRMKSQNNEIATHTVIIYKQYVFNYPTLCKSQALFWYQSQRNAKKTTDINICNKFDKLNLVAQRDSHTMIKWDFSLRCKNVSTYTNQNYILSQYNEVWKSCDNLNGHRKGFCQNLTNIQSKNLMNWVWEESAWAY